MSPRNLFHPEASQRAPMEVIRQIKAPFESKSVKRCKKRSSKEEKRSEEKEEREGINPFLILNSTNFPQS